jgi:hypothetical protein
VTRSCVDFDASSGRDNALAPETAFSGAVNAPGAPISKHMTAEGARAAHSIDERVEFDAGSHLGG